MSLIYIGFSGKAQHGKDTTAGFFKNIIEDYGFKAVVLPFAKELKNMSKEIYGFTDEELYQTKPPHVRTALQKLGTDIIRARFPDFWVKALEKLAEREHKKEYLHTFILVPDVRFENEADFIERNGFVFRLARAKKTFTKKTALTIETGAKKHSSETALDDYKSFYATIKNNGTLEDLKDKATKEIVSLLQTIKQSSNAFPVDGPETFPF